jgi:hypothetical protein
LDKSNFLSPKDNDFFLLSTPLLHLLPFIMDPNKEAAAHSLGFIPSEAGRLLKNGSIYGLIEKLKMIEKYDSLVAADGVVPHP